MLCVNGVCDMFYGALSCVEVSVNVFGVFISACVSGVCVLGYVFLCFCV